MKRKILLLIFTLHLFCFVSHAEDFLTYKINRLKKFEHRLDSLIQIGEKLLKEDANSALNVSLERLYEKKNWIKSSLDLYKNAKPPQLNRYKKLEDEIIKSKKNKDFFQVNLILIEKPPLPVDLLTFQQIKNQRSEVLKDELYNLYKKLLKLKQTDIYWSNLEIVILEPEVIEFYQATGIIPIRNFPPKETFWEKLFGISYQKCQKAAQEDIDNLFKVAKLEIDNYETSLSEEFVVNMDERLLNFKPGSSDFLNSKSVETWLDSVIIKQIKKQTENKHVDSIFIYIVIEGYADEQPFKSIRLSDVDKRKEKNKELSFARAESARKFVVEYLQKNIPEKSQNKIPDYPNFKNIKAIGKGEELPPGITEPKTRDARRRICRFSGNIIIQL